ncbi:hemerythrin domain-containing protein [Streptomyces sp. NPDC046716]|uniref:hemerythrin domain-containing protein n=1 Tax=Streptomyces sp. NPDC046716 TaxID=3157093 RepID=UPI003400C590
MTTRNSVVEELKSDHREVEELIARYDKAPSGSEERKHIADLFTIELVRHSVAEEMYLYPAVRRCVVGGEALADKELEDHAGVEKRLKGLERARTPCGGVRRPGRCFAGGSQRACARRGEQSPPRLQRACTVQELIELGDKVRAAKQTAPTRPHPHAPDSPATLKLLAPGAGLVDRVRDYVTGRGRTTS